jgi:hypothetical protein
MSEIDIEWLVDTARIAGMCFASFVLGMNVMAYAMEQIEKGRKEGNLP